MKQIVYLVFKYLIIILLGYLIINTSFLNTKISKVTNERDSLLRITDFIKDKYIFDSISIYEKQSVDTKSDNYTSDILIAGYSSSLKMYQFDSIQLNPLKYINQTELQSREGIFKINTKIKQNNTILNIKIRDTDTLGKNPSSIVQIQVEP